VAKQGEIDYLKNIGQAADHVAGKPFSDQECGPLLAEIGAVLSLLPPPPASLLDLGCGSGWTSAFFARRGYLVTGQDISEDMIRCANRNKSEGNLAGLRFQAGDFESLAFDGEFDCAVFFDSLHHAEQEEAALRAAYRALRPGGVCVASEPGIGHARDPQSLDAVRRYQVTEKDMPPGKIIRLGRKAGFRSHRVYPHFKFLHAALYGPDKTLAQRLGGVLLALFGYRRSGIVVLRK